jgi:hypothetical protein
MRSSIGGIDRTLFCSSPQLPEVECVDDFGAGSDADPGRRASEELQSKIASFRNSIEYPSLRFCLQMLQRYIAIKLFRLLGKTGKGEGRSQPDKSAAPF